METRFFKTDEKVVLQEELISTVNNMINKKDFNIYTFYDSLEKIISYIEDEHVYHSLRYLILTGPTCYFGAIYYILKYNVLNDSCKKEFDYLKKFIDYEIEVYMLVNFIEAIEKNED